MKYIIAIVILFCLVLYGCKTGRQEGRYAVASDQAISLSQGSGGLWTLRGNELSAGFEPVGSEIVLLNLSVVDSRVNADWLSGGTWSHDRIFTTAVLHSGANLDEGLTVRWNRKTDRIDIGDGQFDREDGNTFMITVNGDSVTIEHIKENIQKGHRIKQLLLRR